MPCGLEWPLEQGELHAAKEVLSQSLTVVTEKTEVNSHTWTPGMSGWT